MPPLLVRDVMTVGVPTCKTSTLVVDIARFLLEKHLEEMVVLNEEGEGVGVCGYEQLIGVFGREGFETLTAEAVMQEGVPELPADISLVAAAQVMRDRGVRVAYMLHNSAGIIYPAAYLSYWHLLRCMTAQDEQGLKDLGISAERQSPLETFYQRRAEARRRAGLKP